MLNALQSLHLWLLAIVLNAWLMSFALVGLWAFRRWVLPRLQLTYDDAYIGAAVAQSCMVLYALIAALTAVGVWQRYTTVSGIVSGEATTIANLWRDLGGYPEPERESMRELLRGYTNQVINEAWPKQRVGQVPREGVEWMDRLQAQLFAVEPKTQAQTILYAETLSTFHDLVQQRRQRLDSVGAGLPGVLWFVLLPGAMGCIILFIGLDRPFSGDMGISAESYQLIYDHHMTQ